MKYVFPIQMSMRPPSDNCNGYLSEACIVVDTSDSANGMANGVTVETMPLPTATIYFGLEFDPETHEEICMLQDSYKRFKENLDLCPKTITRVSLKTVLSCQMQQRRFYFKGCNEFYNRSGSGYVLCVKTWDFSEEAGANSINL